MTTEHSTKTKRELILLCFIDTFPKDVLLGTEFSEINVRDPQQINIGNGHLILSAAYDTSLTERINLS